MSNIALAFIDLFYAVIGVTVIVGSVAYFVGGW